MPTKKEIEYTEYPCDVCESYEAVEMPHVREYTGGQVIHICKNCGFVYVKERRPFEKIAEVWSKELFGKAYTSKSPLMLARHTYIAEFLDQHLKLKGKKVCDIGAGEGQFLNIVKQNYGAQVFGIEPSKFNCKLLMKQKIANFEGTMEEYIDAPLSKLKSFDVVTMMWTLENATYPRSLILGAREILKDKGYIVIATGSRVLVPFAKPLNLYLSKNPADAHPSRFSLNSISSLLKMAGFNVKFVNSYLNDAITLCVIAQKGKTEKNPKIKKDDYRIVQDFFRKWHKDSQWILKINNLK